DEVAVELGKPFGFRDPLARAILGEQRPGPVLLLLFEIGEGFLVEFLVVLSIEELFEKVAVAQERHLALKGEAVRQLLSAELGEEAAAPLGVDDRDRGGRSDEGVFAAAAAKVVEADIAHAVSLDHALILVLDAEQIVATEVEFAAQGRPAQRHLVGKQAPASAR